MAISQNITPLSTPPSRSDPTNFDSRADTFLAELPTLATQINTWAGQANSTASTVTSDASAAATAKTNAETAETNAETAQGLAEAARDTAIAQAATATSQASAAVVSAGTATAQAVIATAQAVIATDQAAIATTQANNAVAVVTGGTATLVPEAGKIPLADANALIDGDWLAMTTGKLTTAKNAYDELTAIQQYMILNMSGLAGYWPADPAYLFEDSAGTIPANTNGTGVVGCWRRVGDPPVYTPVTVANPGFDADSDWTKGTGWTIAGGVATKTAGTASLLTIPVSLTPGTTYLVTWTQTRTAGTITPQLRGGTTVSGDAVNVANTYEETFVSVTGNNLLGFSADAAFAGTIDNVTLVSVSNAPALQPTTAYKPYLRKTQTSNVHWLDSNTSTSALTATLGNLGASCTVCQAGAEGVTFTEGVTISSTYNIAPAFGFNGDVAIFNRALTTTEKALLTRYMQRGMPLLGPEVLVNGGFDAWSAGAPSGWTLSAKDANNYVTESPTGQARFVCNNAIALYTQQSVPGAQRFYRVGVTVSAVASGALKATFISSGAETPSFTAPGTYSYQLRAGVVTTDNFQLRRNGALDVTVDRASLKEIL